MAIYGAGAHSGNGGLPSNHFSTLSLSMNFSQASQFAAFSPHLRVHDTARCEGRDTGWRVSTGATRAGEARDTTGNPGSSSNTHDVLAHASNVSSVGGSKPNLAMLPL